MISRSLQFAYSRNLLLLRPAGALALTQAAMPMPVVSVRYFGGKKRRSRKNPEIATEDESEGANVARSEPEPTPEPTPEPKAA